MKIEIASFEGVQPKLATHLLKDTQAQLAENVRAEKGDLRSWAAGKELVDLTSAAYKSLHQYIISAETNWVYSTNDLDFAKSAIANDSFERLYFTGETEPRVFANDLDSNPWDQTTDYYKLGPAKPTTKPTIDVGYTTNGEYRAYVYTYVTRYGEETGPSPVDSITDYGSGNVTLSAFTQPPAGYALRTKVGSNAPKIRVYRTNSSVDSAEFQYVGEFDIDTFNFSTGTYTDSTSDLGEVMPSEIYEGVNASLKGLIGLTNGIFAGFVGNELHVSEQYLPHAWPDEYRISFDFDIVGLGLDQNNIIVLTEGYTYVVAGATPETLFKQRLPGFYPCISKRGIVSTPYGVLFPSHEGLIRATAEGAVNILHDFITPAEWEEYFPDTIHGYFYNNKYFGWISSNATGIIFDIAQGILTTNGAYHEAGYIKIAEGKFYTINANDQIVEWAGDPYNYQYYRWKSKKFMFSQDTGFTCAQIMVDLEEYDALIDAMAENEYLQGLNDTIFATGELQDTFNAGDGGSNDVTYNVEEFNGSLLYDLSSIQMSNAINFKLYIDNKLVCQRSVTGDNYFRLPPHRGRRVEIQLEGYIPIRRVVVAQSPRELG